MGNINPAGAGTYGKQAAIAARRNPNADMANIRITPKETVKADGSYNNEGVQNFLGYAQENMKLIDGNNGSKRDSFISRSELSTHFRGGDTSKSKQSSADTRAGKFMTSYDRNKDERLGLDEMTGRLMTEASPREAFSKITAKEKKEMQLETMPEIDMPSLTELSMDLRINVENDGVSSMDEREFLKTQAADGTGKAEKAIDHMMEKYELSKAANQFKQQ